MAEKFPTPQERAMQWLLEAANMLAGHRAIVQLDEGHDHRRVSGTCAVEAP